jgi:Mg-chelatase subunit ChlD
VLARPAHATGPRGLWLITDGRPTVRGGSPAAGRHAALAAASLLARQAIPAAVLDTEPGPVRLGFARALAKQLGAEYAHVDSFLRSN